MHFNVLTIMSFTVIIAVVGHMLFDKTGVPESLFMIVLGLILGPLTGIINIDDLSTIIPHVFTLSIVIILLESGLTTDIKEAFETMRTSTIFTIIVLVITSLLCSVFLRLVLNWATLPSLILGVICSGTSTIPILYFTSKMKLNPSVKQMLVFESVINDITIITVVSLILQAVNLKLNPLMTILSIIQYLFVATVLGLTVSAIWTMVLVRGEDLTLKYLTTLAISLLLYFVTESQGGSGVIAVMIFGTTIGNLPDFFRKRLMIKRKVMRFFTQIEVMQDEVTFLVKNTFFFTLGLMFNIQTVTMGIFLVALTLTVIMIVSRGLAYKLIGSIDKRYVDNIWTVSLMVSRGLTAGITAFMPMEQGVQMPPITDIVIVMILFTNIAAIMGFMALTRNKDRAL